MTIMHWLRTTGRLPRALLAALFGLMSFVHLPIMTTAKAGFSPAPMTIAQADHAGHHDHAHHHGHDQPPPAQDAPSACQIICLALGCFQSLTPGHGDAPLLQSLALGQLCPTPSRAMRPALADPAVPPPRLQA